MHVYIVVTCYYSSLFILQQEKKHISKLVADRSTSGDIWWCYAIKWISIPNMTMKALFSKDIKCQVYLWYSKSFKNNNPHFDWIYTLGGTIASLTCEPCNQRSKCKDFMKKLCEVSNFQACAWRERRITQNEKEILIISTAVMSHFWKLNSYSLIQIILTSCSWITLICFFYCCCVLFCFVSCFVLRKH
jgi:hypothetical protein